MNGYYKGLTSIEGAFCGLVKIDGPKSYYFDPQELKWVESEAVAFAWENTTDYDPISEEEAVKIIDNWKKNRKWK